MGQIHMRLTLPHWYKTLNINICHRYNFDVIIGLLYLYLHPIGSIASSFLGAEEADTFELELSGLLTELQCPHESLTQGEMINRFGNEKNRLLLLGTF